MVTGDVVPVLYSYVPLPADKQRRKRLGEAKLPEAQKVKPLELPERKTTRWVK